MVSARDLADLPGRLLRKALRAKAILRFAHHNRRSWGPRPLGGAREILVDSYGVAETLISYSYLLNVLATLVEGSTWSYGPRPPRRDTAMIYHSFGTSGHVLTRPTPEQTKMARAVCGELVPRLRTKDDLLQLEVHGVWVGMEIYESYLRKGHPTVDLESPELRDMVEEGVALLFFWEDYFRQHDVAAVVVSHDCYLHPGLICKVAYREGIPVYLPNVRGLSRVDGPHQIHSSFPDFRRMFRGLPAETQSEGLRWARERLDRRLGGEVGVDMAYATTSAFRGNGSGGRVLRESDRTKVLICTHCFYDNPHGYGGFLFEDFYEWLRYLGGISHRTDYDWYLKVHPDPLPGTYDIVNEVVSHFRRMTVVPHETSHHQLVEEGIDVVLTGYGTVGHEYPLMGVPVVNAGYNPRIAYGFNVHPATVEEYEQTLLSLDSLHLDVDVNDVYEFYFIHHDYTLTDDLIFPSYRRMLSELSFQDRVGPAIYEYFLDGLTGAKHREIIERMERFINSGNNNLFCRDS